MSAEYIAFICSIVVAVLALGWFIHSAVSYEMSMRTKPRDYEAIGYTVTVSPSATERPARLSIHVRGSGQTTWVNMTPQQIDELIAALKEAKP